MRKFFVKGSTVVLRVAILLYDRGITVPGTILAFTAKYVTIDCFSLSSNACQVLVHVRTNVGDARRKRPIGRA